MSDRKHKYKHKYKLEPIENGGWILMQKKANKHLWHGQAIVPNEAKARKMIANLERDEIEL